VKFRELAIPGSWEITPKQFEDPRGVFLELFRDGPFVETVGRRLDLNQANCSVSAAGVVRGIHFAQIPPSQAKYVMCPRGAVLDYVVDIRVGSPTFGAWDSVVLDDTDRRAIFISEGLGHMFVSLEHQSTVVYLCSAPYAPGREWGLNPRCPDVGIRFPEVGRNGEPLNLILSDKDAAAPTLSEAHEMGLLPTLDEQLAFLRSLHR